MNLVDLAEAPLRLSQLLILLLASALPLLVVVAAVVMMLMLPPFTELQVKSQAGPMNFSQFICNFDYRLSTNL